jgi:hypothetical protein
VDGLGAAHAVNRSPAFLEKRFSFLRDDFARARRRPESPL